MATKCSKCGVFIPEKRRTSVPGKVTGAGTVTVCPTCESTSLIAISIRDERENPNLAGALVLGLGAAVVSALLWYVIVVLTNYQLGLVAIAVGWLVAQGVMRGAGGKRGPRLQAMSVAGTLVALALSEYLIVRHFAAQALALQGYGNIPLLLPIETILLLVTEGIQSDPATLLFWGIALWEAFTLPRQRQLHQATREEPSTGGR